MKFRSILLAVAAISLTAYSSLAGGTITNVNAWADGDGAIVCPIYSWDNTDVVGIYGDQYSGPGHIFANINVDSEVDPTLTLNNVIDNDTMFAWTGYQVTVVMNKTFTLSAVAVNSPGDWTVTSVVQPGAPVAGLWTGTMLFSAGTPIAIGDSIDFTFKETFIGSVQTCMTFEPIPEPGAFSLLLAGGLLLAGRSLSRRQPR
jgi:hypothetical protein